MDVGAEGSGRAGAADGSARAGVDVVSARSGRVGSAADGSARAGRAGDTVDVVVAGAGPAGCAAAIVLARAGHRVLIADPCAGSPPAFTIGETVPAVAAAALRDLGIGPDRIDATGAIRGTGTSANWGRGPLLQRDALSDPYGHGWHLDRPRFDALLLAQARAAGAHVRAARVTVRAVDARRARPTARAVDADAVRVQVGASELSCRWLVDAGGRQASIARSLGARRERADRLVAVYGAVRVEDSDVDARTRIEATPSGWWYSAIVAGGRRVVAFLTDPDLLDRALRTRAGFATALAATCNLLPEGAEVELVHGPATTAAHGARLLPAHGARWLAVGDAALAFDPLSSQGILNAIATGIGGGACVDAILRDESRDARSALDTGIGGGARVDACLRGAGEAALAAFERGLAGVWAAYEAHRADAYAIEDRWPAQPFWARRRAAGLPAAPRVPPGLATDAGRVLHHVR